MCFIFKYERIGKDYLIFEKIFNVNNRNESKLIKGILFLKKSWGGGLGNIRERI